MPFIIACARANLPFTIANPFVACSYEKAASIRVGSEKTVCSALLIQELVTEYALFLHHLYFGP